MVFRLIPVSRAACRWDMPSSRTRRDGTSGVDWNKAVEIGYALLLSPVVGFCCAAGLLLIMKFLVRKPELYAEPKIAGAPPLWIRGLLIFTSAGVSFAHGSNDGQKGMMRQNSQRAITMRLAAFV